MYFSFFLITSLGVAIFIKKDWTAKIMNNFCDPEENVCKNEDELKKEDNLKNEDALLNEDGMV